MARESLNNEQQQRADQLHYTHKALSQLRDALKEAEKLHVKYVAAMEKVLDAILENSDCMEETRKLLGAQGEALITPTYEVTGVFCDAYKTWKDCDELRAFHADLRSLVDHGESTKTEVKAAEKATSNLENVVRKAAKFNADKVQQKIGTAQTSSQIKLKEAQTYLNRQVEEINASIEVQMLSIARSWSDTLVSFSRRLGEDHVKLSSVSVALYSQLASMRNPSMTPEQPQQQLSPYPAAAHPGGCIGSYPSSGPSDYPPTVTYNRTVGTVPPQLYASSAEPNKDAYPPKQV